MAQSRLGDIYRELNQLGYDGAVFEFDSTAPRNMSAERALGHVHVLVTNTENGTQKMYEATEGSAWREDFCRDVRAGWFGPPPKGVTLNISVFGVAQQVRIRGAR
jgi:hypothetical protein